MDLPVRACDTEAGNTSRICSCVYLPVKPFTAWKYILGEKVDDEEFVLHGLTHISGIASVNQILKLPNSLWRLTFFHNFNRSVAEVDFPHAGIEFRGPLQPELE